MSQRLRALHHETPLNREPDALLRFFVPYCIWPFVAHPQFLGEYPILSSLRLKTSPGMYPEDKAQARKASYFFFQARQTGALDSAARRFIAIQTKYKRSLVTPGGRAGQFLLQISRFSLRLA